MYGTPTLKMIRCRDLGMDCNAMMKGRNLDEVVDATIKHRVSMHGLNVKELQTDESRAQMASFAQDFEAKK